jgi:hypothetical protein
VENVYIAIVRSAVRKKLQRKLGSGYKNEVYISLEVASEDVV